MGKLANRLKEVSEPPHPPLGFAARGARPKNPTLLLLAAVDGGGESAQQVVAAGADGVLVGNGRGSADALWGAALERGGKEDVERLKAAGAAFALLRGDSLAADALEPEDIDRIMEVDPAWPDALVRSAGQLAVQAMLYRVEGTSLSIRQLLECRRVASLAGKPLIVNVPAGMDTNAVAILRDAGADGLLVDAAVVPQFREALNTLPPPRRPKEREPIAAILPSLGAPPSHEHEEEEEDDE